MYAILDHDNWINYQWRFQLFSTLVVDSKNYGIQKLDIFIKTYFEKKQKNTQEIININKIMNKILYKLETLIFSDGYLALQKSY